MEPSADTAGGGGGNEDIRAKLARYKKEREDFEVIRQQFRKKNSELGVSSSSGPGSKATGLSYPEKSPNSYGGSELNHHKTGQNNIFAANSDQSHG